MSNFSYFQGLALFGLEDQELGEEEQLHKYSIPILVSNNISQESIKWGNQATNEELKTEVQDSLNGFVGGFIENKGQKNEAIYFYTESPEMGVGFGTSEIRFSIINPSTNRVESYDPLDDHGIRTSVTYTTISLAFLGSNQIIPVAEDPTGAFNNYFVGSDEIKYVISCQYYTKMIYQNIYDKIDLVYELKEAQLKYEFFVHPGGNPKDIKLHWIGPVSLEFVDNGIKITTQVDDTIDGETESTAGFVDTTPICYQSTKREHKVEGSFEAVDSKTYGFHVPNYDPRKLLIIDPLVLSYSTYVGGSGTDSGSDIAVDDAGNVYITGTTASIDFPTVNANDPSYNSGEDVFVFKLNSTGNGLLYSTYIGGSGADRGFDIAVDGTGNAYVTGRTTSTNFPTINPYETDDGAWDVFVFKLNSTGNGLLYSTYVGGNNDDYAYGIVVDDAGNAYITGDTYSYDFPTVKAYEADDSNLDIFVFKLAASGSDLLYSTYVGGSSIDYSRDIALDGEGNVYVTGFTASNNFPTVNALDSTYNGGAFDALVFKFAAEGNDLLYSTYVGGTSEDRGHRIAVDRTENAYVTGFTASSNFPTVNAYETNDGANDVFVFKLNNTGTGLEYSTYIGGSGNEEPSGIDIDDLGNAYIAGRTLSTNFPTVNAYNTTSDGNSSTWDVFLLKLNNPGNALLYSTYLGGSGQDSSRTVVLDGVGNAYMTGYTTSTDFPTVNAYNMTGNGGQEVFVTKFSYYYNPIYITANSNFTALGIPGAGTPSNPYVIEGNSFINSTTTLIHIQDTSSHFIIRNNWLNGITGANDGIYLQNVTNGIITNNNIGYCSNGVNLYTAFDNLLTNNNIFNSSSHGVYIQYSSSYNNISRNIISNCSSRGINIHNSSSNFMRFEWNNFIDNSLSLPNAMQAYDDGWSNTYNYNYWNDWISPDADGNGFIDIQYPLNGSASSYDPHPLAHPYYGYLTRDPIYIDDNTDFGPSGYNFTGSGTQIDPYLIEGYNITDFSQDLIEIRGTTVYFEIRDCILNGINNSYYGIHFWNVGNGTIEDITLYNCIYGLYIQSSQNNNITNSDFFNNSEMGIYLSTSSFCRFINNNVSHNNDGILIWSSSNNIFSENIAHNNSYGITLYWSNTFLNMITNNTVYNNTYHGIFLGRYIVYNFIIGNTVFENLNGIHLWIATNNTISNNECFNNINDGISIWSESDYNRFFDNLVLNNLDDGIGFYNASYNIFQGNSIFNNIGVGIDIDSDCKNNTVTWNHFLGNNLGGTQAIDSGVTNILSYNYWDDHPGPDSEPDGLFDSPYTILGGINSDPYPLTQPFAPHAPIYITKNSDFAILGFSGTGTVNDPYVIEQFFIINSTNNHLIHIEHTTVHFSIRNNVINCVNGSPYGIFLENVTNGAIINNTIHSGYRSIHIWWSANINIADNTIFNISNQGIYVATSEILNLSHNIIFNTTASGIYLSGCNKSVLSGNTIYDCNERGIILYLASNCTVSGNSIYNNRLIGIILDSSININVSFNTLYNNQGGIYLSTSSNNNTMFFNRIFNNTQNGIDLRDSNNCTLFNNTIFSNGEDGIRIDSAIYSNITKNIIYNNGYGGGNNAGIYLYQADYNMISNNKVNDNWIVGVELVYSCDDNIINHNIVSGSTLGFHLLGTPSTCERNFLFNNTVYNTTWGIGVDGGLINSTIYKNTIFNNSGSGIQVEGSNTNVFENIIFDNGEGIFLHSASSNSTITLNAFIDNNQQARDDGTGNIVIYNYWNDWTSPDDNNDGFVDSPYIFTGNSDPHPIIFLAERYTFIEGDWTITGSEYYQDETIVLTGNLIISSTGDLTFHNVILSINCSSDGQFHIEVNTGGTLTIEANSTVTTLNVTNTWYLKANSGSYIKLTNSSFNYAGWSYGNNGDNSGIWINSNSTEIKDCSIHHNYFGIFLYQVENVNITRNTIYNNTLYGLYLHTANNNTLIENKVFNHTETGFYLNSASDNDFINNTIYDNQFGFRLASASRYNTLNNNSIYNTALELADYGVYFSGTAHNNTLLNNTIYACGIGIQIGTNYNNISYNIIYTSAQRGIVATGIGNIFINNTINDHFIGIYLMNGGATDAIISENVMYNNVYCVFLQGADNNQIYHNIFNNSDHGIRLDPGSRNNFISENLFGQNSQNGLYLRSSSDNNITFNTFWDNVYGIRFESSEANIIFNNSIVTDTGTCLYFDSTSGFNRFHRNDILTNTGTEATDNNGTNIFHHLGLGNYWGSAYIGLDTNNDRVGDIPFSIGGSVGNQDPYPLMFPIDWYSSFNITLIDGDWTVSTYEFHQNKILVLNGNVTIQSGGNLTLKNVIIRFNCTYDGEYRVEVNNGGNLSITTNSILTAVNTSNTWYLKANGGSNIYFKNSTFNYAGYAGTSRDYGGIWINTDYSEITNCTFHNNHYGLILDFADFSEITDNIIRDITLNGIRLYNSNNNSFSGNIITNTMLSYAIFLDWSNYNTFFDNLVNESFASGINLNMGCSYNNFSQNTILKSEGAQGAGISLSFDSDFNLFFNNSIFENGRFGINLNLAHNNILLENRISDNSDYGVYTNNCENNSVMWNKFINNNQGGIQARDTGSNNTFKYNYWDDHTGPDANFDGIVDVPYIFTGNDDPYPLTQQYTGHEPIFINQNADFAALGFPGNGTELDPYIIQEYYISSSTSRLIDIRGTSAFVTIRNCFLDGVNNSYEGIFLQNVTHLLITNITLYRSVYGIMLRDFTFNNTITNSTIAYNSDTGIYLYNSPFNNSITNNRIFNDTFYGIRLYNAPNNNLLYNMIYNNTLDGIVVENASNNCIILGNIVNKNARYGIYVAGSDYCNISTNFVFNNSNHGLYLWQSTYCRISSGNTIYNNTGHGISLSSSNNNRFYNNTIRDNSQYGFNLFSSTNNTLSNNTINNNSNYGIFLFSSSNNNNITENIITNNGNDGIFLQGVSNNNLVNNTITGHTHGGIYLEGSCDQNVLFNNSIINCNTGILISASDSNEIFDNFIIDSLWDGIYMSQADYNIFTNNVINNAQTGIMISQSENNTFLSNFIANSPTWYGIYLVNSANNNTFSYNIIQYNDLYGIYLTSSSANNTVIWNNFIGNNLGVSQAYDNSPNNTFKYNYWDDRTTPDTDPLDGYVDTPYSIDGGSNTDSYPRAYPYFPHNPIYIDKDTDFAALGFPGQGTENDPYIIEEYFIINSTTQLIYVRNTTAYFIIRNNLLNGINGVSYGIYLDNTTHGLIVNNKIVSSSIGIIVFSSSNSTVHSNTIYNSSYYGLILMLSDNNTISSNIVYNNTHMGIIVQTCINNILFNNTIYNHFNDSFGFGIVLNLNANSNTILNNTIYNNINDGIWVNSSTHNTISSNRIYNNSRNGIFMNASSSHNTLSDNTLYNNSENGISLESSAFNNTIISNSIYNNSLDGIWIDHAHNNTLLSNVIQDQRYGISLISSHNTTCSYNSVHNSSTSIYMAFANFSTIIGNNASYNVIVGITLGYSFHNIIINNSFSNNNHVGVYIFYSSFNFVMTNLISNHLNDTIWGVGILLSFDSINNTITNNTISDNVNFGIMLVPPSPANNTIKWNDFVNNNLLNTSGFGSSQAYDNGTSNLFTNNFWSDWTGPDTEPDGIVDYPYIINGSAGNSDLYPVTFSAIHELSIPIVLFPNGGETLFGTISIEWTAAIDSYGYEVTYEVLFSANNGITWVSLASGLTGLSRLWDTTSYLNSTTYLIRIIATSDGLEEEDISDGTFTIQNPPVYLPIIITSDTDFAALGFPGDGTESNPYIIEGLYIANASMFLIVIQDTTAYFIIRDNTLNGISGEFTGIYLFNVNYGTIENNQIYNCSNGISIDNSDNNVVFNNEIHSNSENGIYLLESSFNDISANTIRFNGANGIFLINSDDNTISDNIIYENGYFVSSTGVGASTEIVSNPQSSNRGNGIFLDPADENMIYNNKIYDNSENGIYLLDSDDTNISSNTINGNGANGIFLNDSILNIISDNVIYGNGYNGAEHGVGASIDAHSSLQSSNRGNGIFLDPANDNSIYNNSIYGNTENGVYLLESDNINISDNTINDNGANGVFLKDSNENNISNNIIYENGYNGAENGVGASIDATTGLQYSNRGNGIFLDPADSNIISFNNIYDNFENGIYILESETTLIFDNSIFENGANGIFLAISSFNQIFDNIISFNGYIAGFAGVGSSIDTSTGLQASNRGNGIFLGRSDNNNISYNIISNNTNYGVNINKTSDNNEVEWNDFFGNNPDGDSQAFDEGSNNLFSYNYWDDHENLDQDGDGVADENYSIGGSANNLDSSPMATPEGGLIDVPTPLSDTTLMIVLVLLLVVISGMTIAFVFRKRLRTKFGLYRRRLKSRSDKRKRRDYDHLAQKAEELAKIWEKDNEN